MGVDIDIRMTVAKERSYVNDNKYGFDFAPL